MAVFRAGHYEDDASMNSTWSTGDWNADGDFTSNDVVVAFQDGRYSVPGHPVAASAVPEPTSLATLLTALIGFVIVSNTRRKSV